MDKRAILKVTGTVQGVFFRHSAKLMANELGLTGYCRNEIDGSVLIVVEGPTERINEFIKWAGQGPPDAHVDDVDISFEEASGEFGYFRIE